MRRQSDNTIMAIEYPHTKLAVENFPISQLRFSRAFLRALGLIKAAAAKVNGESGALAPQMAAAIQADGNQVAEGHPDAQFDVDIFQTGNGHSNTTNAS